MRSKSWKRSYESAIERRIERPALLTRMSTLPCSASTSSAMRSTSSVSERSARWMWASPPASSISFLVSSSFSGVRATSSTVAPASAALIAAALPIPEEAPVIITVLPPIAPESERSLNRSGSRLRSQ